MKLSKKKMIPIGLLTGLTVTSAIVTPLCCSCSVNQDATADHPIDPDGTDKKYNITDATYKALETQYTEKFEERLARTNQTLATRRQEREEFKESLKNLANQTNSKDVSFSTRCDTIIDHAKQNYNIQLNRQNILDFKNIEQDFATTQETYVNGLRNYMNSMKMDSSKIEEHVANFRTNFNTLQAELRSADNINGFADPLRALKETKFQAFSCMSGITAEIDRISATNKLKEFFKNVRFAIKEKDAPTWDQILGKTGTWHQQHPEFSVGKDVTNCLNLVFDCFVKDKQGVEHKVDLETDEWTTNLVPAYKIGVIFAKADEGAQCNLHNIDMDFTLVRQDALTKDAEYIRTATAHNTTLKDYDGINKYNSYDDLLKADESKKHYLSFNLPVTDDYAKTLVKTEYADKLEFYWDKRENCAYENFFTRTSKQGDNVSLTMSQLAAAGLMVSPKYHHEQGQRLDYLLTHIDHKSDDILQRFITTCNLSASSVVNNEVGHIVSNTIYISFANQVKAKHQLLGNYNCSGFPISKQFYKNSYDVFINYYEHFAFYDVNFTNKHIKENVVKSLLLERAAETVSYCLTASVTTALTLVMGLKLLFNPLSAPRKILAMTLLGICTGLCIADTVIVNKQSIQPVKDFYDAIKDIPDRCPEYKNLWKVAKDDYDKIYCDYNTFKDISFDTARKKMIDYLSMSNNNDYLKFEKYLVDNHLTKDDYEALKEINYISIIVSVTCTVLSIFVSCWIIKVTNPEEHGAATAVQAKGTQGLVKAQEVAKVNRIVSEKMERVAELGWSASKMKELEVGARFTALKNLGVKNLQGMEIVIPVDPNP